MVRKIEPVMLPGQFQHRLRSLDPAVLLVETNVGKTRRLHLADCRPQFPGQQFQQRRLAAAVIPC